jgi:hypothetical protein
MRSLIMRGVLSAVLLLALVVWLAGSSGEVSAAEPSLCELLASDIDIAAGQLSFFSSARKSARAATAALAADEGFAAAVKDLQEVRDYYSEAARELETLLVIRRELGCQKGDGRRGG